MKGYAVVLGILLTLLTGMLFLRNDIEARILRIPGQLYEYKADNMISNVYTYKLVNKTVSDINNVNFKLRSTVGTIHVVSQKDFNVSKEGLAEGTLFIEINASALSSDKNNLIIDVYSNNELIESTSTSFLGPRSYK